VISVAAVDPGRTIGLARVGLENGAFVALQETDPLVVFQTLLRWVDGVGLRAIIVEDYVGGGVQSSDGLYTAKLAGFFEYAGKVHGLPVRMRVPQKRLAGLSRAREHNYPVHATDALAHCYAEIRREHL
jgi:hypothetical protein